MYINIIRCNNFTLSRKMFPLCLEHLREKAFHTDNIAAAQAAVEE